MTDSEATRSQLDKWTVPECPFAIEYRHSLLQELRAAVAYGQRALSRGGMEVGGVLFGTRSDRGISIRAWRPIACEHASGPALVLSERDRAELKKFLAESATLPDFSGVEPLGWFLSHTRSDISLRESDLDLYREFFPAATDVALVLRPGRHNAARAGFFFRNADGTVRSDQSLLEFNIEHEEAGWASVLLDQSPAPAIAVAMPAQSAQPHKPAPAGPSPDPSSSNRDEAPTRAPIPMSAPPVDDDDLKPQLTSRRSWRWIALPIAALAGIGWLYVARNRAADPTVIPIDMTVTDRAGELIVEWDRSRPELRGVRSGSLFVDDGGYTANFHLTPAEAQAGSFTWTRMSGDVQVALHFAGAGKPLAAFARFIGGPPPPRMPVHDTVADSAELDRLHKENEDLRSQVVRAKAQAAQSEAVIHILRERVSAAEAKK
jgi:hypothetical protein